MNYFVSVIICTYNRCQDLKGVLDSLLKQIDGYLIYEVIIADNNSSDRTKDILLEYAPRFGGRLKYIFEARQGKSHALNKAVQSAKGNIICLTDDDVVLDEYWVRKTIECFNQHHCDVVGGRVLPVFPQGTSQWVKDYAAKLAGSVVVYDYGDRTFEYKGESFPFIGANLSVRREVFEQVGLFRTDLGVGTGTVGEDTEFVQRLLSQHKNLFYCGEALVWHPFDPKRLSLKYIALWNISFGKYATRMESERRASFIYYFGIPRYLIRGIVEDFLKLISVFWSKPNFFITWRNLFCKLGMIQEYYKFHRNGSKSCLRSA